MNDFKSRSKVVLEELKGHNETQQISMSDSDPTPPTDLNQDQPRELRHSGRVSHRPVFFGHEGEVNQTESLMVEDDPLSYEQAMTDVDAKSWQEAMNKELDSMKSNSVWDLVDLPEGVKLIGCKWIYKRKKNAEDKVKTFKVRLVAKGYT